MIRVEISLQSGQTIPAFIKGRHYKKLFGNKLAPVGWWRGIIAWCKGVK